MKHLPKSVIIVSKCLGRSKLSGRFRFHFVGLMNGRPVLGVQLSWPHDEEPKEGQEYLMYCSVTYRQGFIIGKAMRQKPLPECWDNEG